MADGATLDVVDVLPIQLENLARKLAGGPPVRLHRGDSAALPFESGTHERALLFFLLHEQPAEVRRRTLTEALRVLKPGGRLVIVDYHRPNRTNPLYWPMAAILRSLEPFAMDLWRDELTVWLPAGAFSVQKQTFFGRLYQMVIIKKEGP
jgi:ubiquinone/menaquinone biosynthesis C-methylase UbiE